MKSVESGRGYCMSAEHESERILVFEEPLRHCKGFLFSCKRTADTEEKTYKGAKANGRRQPSPISEIKSSGALFFNSSIYKIMKRLGKNSIACLAAMLFAAGTAFAQEGVETAVGADLVSGYYWR